MNSRNSLTGITALLGLIDFADRVLIASSVKLLIMIYALTINHYFTMEIIQLNSLSFLIFYLLQIFVS